MDLKTIYSPIKGDLAAVEGEFGRLSAKWHDTFPQLEEMLSHSLIGGKALRPALTFIAGRALGGRRETILPMATANELMHIATLVHDDAIDKADTRRGRLTVNKLWGLEKAILLGDFLFARAGEFAASTDNLEVTKLFSRTLGKISVGELRQSYSAFSPIQAMDIYLERIAGKTAALFELSCVSGGILAGADNVQENALRDYAHYLGLAFQIVDDILDFVGTEEELGKPVGSDLRQGTVTLPALLLMERFPDHNPVRRFLDAGHDPDCVVQAVEMIKNSTIIDDCYTRATQYSAKAAASLGILPASQAKKALVSLADYLIKRRN